MYKELLTSVSDMGGLFKAASITDEHLFRVQDELEKLGQHLPDDYSDFLFVTDGFYWGGLEFFGSSQLMDKKNGFSITDLFSQNKLYQALNEGTPKVFLGRSDEENFLYNPENQRYEIVDEFSGELVKDFSDFEELFTYIVNEQMELIQNYVGFNEDELAGEEEEDF